MKNHYPTTTASAHYTRTVNGIAIINVRLVSPDRIDWRRYRPGLPHDVAIQQALASAGIDRAWCQAALPMGPDEPDC